MLSYSLEIIGVYIGINLLINLFLAYRVSANRVRSNVMTGTGEDTGLYNANRAHVTNVEYTPIILIGLVALHLLSGSIYVIHAVGLLLTVGRILHAIGLTTAAGKSTPPRLIGTVLTWLAQLVAGVGCLYYALL
jgi:uncharacterized membrane protein YecN with MAPEG domain